MLKIPCIRFCLLVCAGLSLTILSFRADGQEVVLQNDSLLVAFDSHSGALVRLERKSTHWVLENRPQLGVPFRLFVPLPTRRDNFVLGRALEVKVKKIADTQVRIEWHRLVSEHGGVLPINLTALITLDKEGRLSFSVMVENRSAYTVETVDYPYLGDLSAPEPHSTMRVRTMWYDNLESDEIYPHFRNEKGYWGVFSPQKTFNSWRSLFCLIQSQGQGLYVGMANSTQPYLLQYTFVQKPGLLSSVTNLVPEDSEISSKPVHLEFRTCHFAYVRPHTTKKLVPVVLEGYTGDWHAGVDLYKKWRASWFHQPKLPDWVKEVHSWQQLQISSPVQDYRVPYSQLVEYGKECKENGVKAIQLVGWNKGGQDGGDPSLDTDPGLGTWQQLHDAIAAIQAMGVKVILFGKLNWADRTTPGARALSKYAATDPYGIPYEQGGYSYYTPTELAGIDQHGRYVMDVLSPGYQHIAVNEFRKTLALGAAGWLWDEVCHHGPVLYSFSKGHGYDPPGYIYAGDMPLARLLHEAAEEKYPDFVFAGEGPQDWLMQYYPVSYFRIDANSTPVERYIAPFAPLMVAVTGYDDREMLNLILMDRYIISYEPRYFKGHLRDFPLTLAYGRKIDSLRRRYSDYLWDATFCDNQGATVSSDGAIRYSVFRAASGKRAVVLVNPASHKTVKARVSLPDAGKLVWVTPEDPDPHVVLGELSIPPRSAAVILEQ